MCHCRGKLNLARAERPYAASPSLGLDHPARCLASTTLSSRRSPQQITDVASSTSCCISCGLLRRRGRLSGAGPRSADGLSGAQPRDRRVSAVKALPRGEFDMYLSVFASFKTIRAALRSRRASFSLAFSAESRPQLSSEKGRYAPPQMPCIIANPTTAATQHL